ncbi:uncharacterized protein [Antedon mediterranea]|uniref:uncharacterized protein n=1 Tax=Antedon mediterranea TaxID=105859 RepID=UPI003AF4DD6C
MNSDDYWIQPTQLYGNYQTFLHCYVKNIMAIGDEVKRGMHWPPSWMNQDDKGQKSGKIKEIIIDNGNVTAVVEFGPPPNDAIQCPMYNGAYYLLPLRPFAMLTWVEF